MLAFLARELRRQFRFHPGVEVALVIGSAGGWHPVPLETEHLAVLGERRDPKPRRLAGHRLYVGLAAEHCGRNGDRRLDVQVAPLALEDRMRRQSYAKEEVTAGGAADALFAFARHPDAGAIVHACRDANVDRLRLTVRLLHREPTRGAVIGIFERELDLVFDVAAAAGARTGGGATRVRVGESAAKERSEEHTSELQSLRHLVCRLL